MPLYKVDYNYYTDLKYDSFMIEAVDIVSAENIAEDKLDELSLINPMVDCIEEIKVPTTNG